MSQSADERKPLCEADEVAIVQVRVPVEEEMRRPVFPDVAKVKAGP